MDSRKTINSPKAFLDLLTQLLSAKEKVSLLIDEGGITRMEGYLTTIDHLPEDPVIIMDNGSSFTLSQLIAVNGNFRSDYSEC